MVLDSFDTNLDHFHLKAFYRGCCL